MTSAMLQGSFVRAAKRAPYLKREHEHELAVRWKNNQDQRAMHIIARRTHAASSSLWRQSSRLSGFP